MLKVNVFWIKQNECFAFGCPKTMYDIINTMRILLGRGGQLEITGRVI